MNAQLLKHADYPWSGVQVRHPAKAKESITAGQAVMAFKLSGEPAEVWIRPTDSETPSASILGIAEEDASSGQSAYVTFVGVAEVSTTLSGLPNAASGYPLRPAAAGAVTTENGSGIGRRFATIYGHPSDNKVHVFGFAAF